jgi:RES domain-containing protein
LRFASEAFRAHDLMWAWSPLSGAGAALMGRRFNMKGQNALYLSLRPETALREVTAGFAHRLRPLILCSYDVDCEDIIDLRDDTARATANVTRDELACPWAEDLARGGEPASHAMVRRLVKTGAAGILVPSFATGARADDANLVLWRWGPALPHRVAVFDPNGRLSKPPPTAS